MNILIIGSKGFIGSHCVRYFSKEHKVWECDVVTDYVTENYFLVSATNANFSDIFKAQEFDFCINCAGAASVPNSLKNPERDFNLNTVNVYKQLEAIRTYNSHCKYINLSSAAVYGNPQQLPITESHPLLPISPYGRHKNMAEDICQEFYDIFDIKSCSLRIFSAYGEGLFKQLFWDLHHKASSKNNIKLFGTGNETRDFIHVKDLVVAIECVMNKADFKHDVINVANGVEHSINSVVKLFFSFYKKENDFKFNGENRKGDPVNWVADITKLIGMGYKASISIEKGIKDYTQWVKELN